MSNKRKIIIELTVDWEGYEDVSDELIIEDSGILESMKAGISYEIIKNNSNNEQQIQRGK